MIYHNLIIIIIFIVLSAMFVMIRYNIHYDTIFIMIHYDNHYDIIFKMIHYNTILLRFITPLMTI